MYTEQLSNTVKYIFYEYAALFHRCYKFNLNWNRLMSPRCSSRLSKASKTRVRKCPTPSQDVKPRCRTRRMGLKKDDGCTSDSDDEKDLLSLINGSRGDAVELVDNGLDASDEGLASDRCSVVSGPSVVLLTPSKKPKPPVALCSGCRQLYQKAERTKAPIKNKLLDNG